MELRDYLEVARKRWRLIAFVSLAVLALAAVWTIATPKTYAATARFFVNTTSSGDSNASALQQGNTFTQARVKSYTQVLTSPLVLDPVIAATGLNVSSETLARQITATVPLDTVVIEVTATAAAPAEAMKIATSLTTVFPRTLADIETLPASKTSPVKVTVLQKATLEPGAVSPKPARNLALGAILGLLLGFGAALLREVLDQRVRSLSDVADITDGTVLGAIAFDSDAPDHPLIVQVDPRSQRAEAFRSLRTNLQFVDVANPPTSLVITSSVPSEGKSTTAANLALSLADAGQRVVIIEGDLRRPRLLEYLGFEGAVGLTDVLIGRVEVEDALQQFGRSSLWLLGAGAIPPNPSELLGSETMEALIERLADEYDYVLVDAPPLLPVTDAAVLSTVVDGALVVVGADVVHRDQLRHALGNLEAVNGNLLGLILNKVSAKSGSAYGTYSYAYEQEASRPRSKGGRGDTKRAQAIDSAAPTDTTRSADVTVAPPSR